uniref:Uncharacterized protein n=1 Tax=Cacopsylla melanoneura TaxID=428564 RepID=A0A8D8QKC5_9HEMI
MQDDSNVNSFTTNNSSTTVNNASESVNNTDNNPELTANAEPLVQDKTQLQTNKPDRMQDDDTIVDSVKPNGNEAPFPAITLTNARKSLKTDNDNITNVGPFNANSSITGKSAMNSVVNNARKSLYNKTNDIIANVDPFNSSTTGQPPVTNSGSNVNNTSEPFNGSVTNTGINVKNTSEPFNGSVGMVNDTLSRMSNASEPYKSNSNSKAVRRVSLNNANEATNNRTNTDGIVRMTDNKSDTERLVNDTVSKHAENLSKHAPRNEGPMIKSWLSLSLTLHAVYYLVQ